MPIETGRIHKLQDGSTFDCASVVAGNWKNFTHFQWFNEPDDSDRWTIQYTHNRDSGLLALSNASYVDAVMAPHIGKDCQKESHNHFACGWVAGYAIRVFDERGLITKAFEAWFDIQIKLENYPVLDEGDYCKRQHSATLDRILDVMGTPRPHSEATVRLAMDVYGWLADHEEREIEDHDDRGGYPSKDSVKRALKAIKSKKAKKKAKK